MGKQRVQQPRVIHLVTNTSIRAFTRSFYYHPVPGCLGYPARSIIHVQHPGVPLLQHALKTNIAYNTSYIQGVNGPITFLCGSLRQTY